MCVAAMAQKMLESMKTIPEIASMVWYSGIREQLFTVIGTVDGVHEEGGWFYATCSQCRKNLDVVNGAFWCSICNGSSLYPMARFRIHLRVQDGGGEAILNLYNQQAERLLDTSANPVPPVSLPPSRRRKVKRKRSSPAVALVDRDEVPSSGKEPCGSAESTCACDAAVAKAGP